MSQEREKQKQILQQQGIQLDPLTIHNQPFANSFRGYDKDEVDDFLDLIIKDYETMYKLISERLSLSAPVASGVASGMQSRRSSAKSSEDADEMTEIKVRLANLERKVFGSGGTGNH